MFDKYLELRKCRCNWGNVAGLTILLLYVHMGVIHLKLLPTRYVLCLLLLASTSHYFDLICKLQLKCNKLKILLKSSSIRKSHQGCWWQLKLLHVFFHISSCWLLMGPSKNQSPSQPCSHYSWHLQSVLLKLPTSWSFLFQLGTESLAQPLPPLSLPCISSRYPSTSLTPH